MSAPGGLVIRALRDFMATVHTVERRDLSVRLWCGIDWAEHHHDVSVVDETGRQRARLRIEDTAAGFGQLMGLLAEQNAVSEAPITVAISIEW
jgi:hypothetical protein